VAENMKEYKVFINKSTVPVGTGEMCKKLMSEIAPQAKFDIVSNPEFLRE
jgi:UDPglucose 6-dehydrogenase